MTFDTSKLSQAAARKTTLHDNCIVLDLGTGTYPRDIEVRLPDDDGARQIAIWDGSLDLAINDEVLCDEYAGNPKWRVAGMGGADSGAGKQRVSKVWESDFGAVAMETDASGNVTINGARTLTIPTDLIHASDPDTKLSFADDALEATVGNLPMLKLTETAQNLAEIGGTGGEDVDISFNNGQIFLQGSDGFLGVNTIEPGQQIDAVADEASSIFRFTAYKAANANIAGFTQFRAARGSLASPTALLDNDRIGGLTAIGYDGIAFPVPYSAGVLLMADENWTGSAHGTRLDFETIKAGTTTRSVKMTLKADGDLILGGTSTGARLVVNNVGGGTQPTLRLTSDAGQQNAIVEGTLNGGLQFRLRDNSIADEIVFTNAALTDLFVINRSGFFEVFETTAPGAGAANTARLFARDDGGGDTELCVRFNSGLIQVIAPLEFGGISVEGNTTPTTIAGAGTKVQITVFDTNEAANGAVPDHINDHITVAKNGTYMIMCSITAESVSGLGAKFHFDAYKNNGAIHLSGVHASRQLAGGGGDTGAIPISGPAVLSAGDTIEVWVTNITNTQNLIIEDINLAIFMIGVNA